MPEKTAIVAEKAPAALGPYSAAISVGPFVYCSGQTPIDPATGELVPGTVADQARGDEWRLRRVLRRAVPSAIDGGCRRAAQVRQRRDRGRGGQTVARRAVHARQATPAGFELTGVAVLLGG